MKKIFLKLAFFIISFLNNNCNEAIKDPRTSKTATKIFPTLINNPDNNCSKS